MSNGVDALNREPAVQELLAKAEEQEESNNNGAPTESSDTPETPKLTTAKEAEEKMSTVQSKRTSMPKILMDGVIPRANSDVSLSGARSPKIMMDEGFERPFSLGGKDIETEEQTLANDKVLKEDTSKSDRAVGEVDPASVELPKSPALEEPAGVSIVLPEAVTEDADAGSQEEAIVTDSTSGTESTAEKLAALPSTRKQYSADVLLPLLIFSVVKSNPPMLISNLR